MPHVLAIGEALIDALATEFADSLQDTKNFSIQTGGSPTNFCSYLKQLGVDASLIATVGRDGFGAVVLQTLREKGVATEHILQLEDHFTTLIVVSRSTGTPDFLPYRGADRYLRRPDPQLVAAADLVHTTAFALSRQPARGIILECLAQASDAGKLISVDWNYSGKIWRKQKKARKVFEKICRLQPLLKVSLDDMERYLEQPLTIETAKSFLEGLPAAVVCLTCGKDGVWFKGAGSSWGYCPATPVVVKDATGAGDSFWAGFVAAFLQGADLERSVIIGIETAAKKLQDLPLSRVSGQALYPKS